MRSRAEAQERILERSLVQNGGFLKALGQDLWAGVVMIHLVVGGGKGKGGFQKNFWMLKRTNRILETLPLSS